MMWGGPPWSPIPPKSVAREKGGFWGVGNTIGSTKNRDLKMGASGVFQSMASGESKGRPHVVTHIQVVLNKL